MAHVSKPDVDFVFGLSPVISIEQKTVASNPRSTVGTLTDIASYLNLLYVVFTELRKKGCRELIIDRRRVDISNEVEIDESSVTNMDAVVDPDFFMFNNPESACRTCGGLGVDKLTHPDLLIPDPKRSIVGATASSHGR